MDWTAAPRLARGACIWRDLAVFPGPAHVLRLIPADRARRVQAAVHGAVAAPLASCAYLRAGSARVSCTGGGTKARNERVCAADWIKCGPPREEREKASRASTRSDPPHTDRPLSPPGRQRCRP